MADPNPILIVDTGDGERRVDLWSYLDAEAIERAERDANGWISRCATSPLTASRCGIAFCFEAIRSGGSPNSIFTSDGWS